MTTLAPLRNGASVRHTEQPSSPSTPSFPETEDTDAPYILEGEHTQRIVRWIDALWRNGRTPMLWGSPGVGKTALVEALSRRPNCSGMVRVLLGGADKADALGMPSRGEVVGKNGRYDVTVHATPDWAVTAAESDPSKEFVVFPDEIPQAEMDVQGTFLTILQSRVMPNGLVLPPNVKFICAGNPTAEVASGFELIEPLQNRLAHAVYAPPKDEWAKGLRDAWGKQVTEEERTLRALLAGFVITNEGYIHNPPKGAVTDPLKNAWSSRRSIDNFASCGWEFLGSRDDLMFLATSFIGETAAMDFVTQVFMLDRHDPEEIVNDPSIVDWSNPLAVYYNLSAVVSWVSRPDQIASAIDVINYASHNGPIDMATISYKEWAQKIHALIPNPAYKVQYIKMIDRETMGEFLPLLFNR